MANFGRDPDTDAVALINDAIAANNTAADSLEKNAADDQAALNLRLARAMEFRKANEILMAQLAILQGEAANV